VLIDNHREVVGEGYAAAGGDQGLGLYGFVAVAGKQPRWIEPVPAEDMFGQVGCASVVRPDPGIAGKVGWIDHWGQGKAVVGRQQNLDRIVEQSLKTTRPRRPWPRFAGESAPVMRPPRRRQTASR
jgi:hypothetical protein